MTTVLGLNDKFPIYPYDNRLRFIEENFEHLQATKKRKSSFFMILIGPKPFPPVLYFLCQEAQTKIYLLS